MVEIGISEYRELIVKLVEKISDARLVYGVPKNGSIIVESLRQFGMIPVETPEVADVIVDDLIDSGRTKSRYEKYKKPFFTLIDKQKDYNNEWIHFWFENEIENDKENLIVRQLEMLGENPNRDGLIETPNRVVQSWKTLFSGYNQKPEDVIKTFDIEDYDEMIILSNIEYYSVCEHHMLPFYGKAWIGYIPDKKVIGISKLARLLEIYSRRLQIQERIGVQITKVIDEFLKPQGSACLLKAKHLCMMCRGIQKQNSEMITSSLTGIFKENYKVRNEFMEIIE